ncbi:palmitoyltransferase hip14 [Anaeramoeba ignava]|uniref:Palmitoyltransferase n=1 Tax=Anaeramoeba ignava TaxID=1746090 RepID=A0A9Q0LGU9_ANAIG|nr:palmitoyltransferase hip14 [Anaeramoeba ignava]
MEKGNNLEIEFPKQIIPPDRKKTFIIHQFKRLILENKVKECEKHIENYSISHQLKDEKGNTPMHWIAENNLYNIAEMLIQKGFPVDTLNDDQSTPLHLASSKDYVGIVKLLIDNGADPSTPDDIKSHAIHVACQCNAYLTVQYLITEANISVDSPDDDNKQAPLHWASYRGNIHIQTLLLNHGANVNIQDSNLETPLHLACSQGFIDSAAILLNSGADSSLKNSFEETPFETAIQTNQTSVANFLQSKISKNQASPLYIPINQRIRVFFFIPILTLFICYLIFSIFSLAVSFSLIFIVTYIVGFNIQRLWKVQGELNPPRDPIRFGYFMGILLHLYISYYLYFIFISFKFTIFSSLLFIIFSAILPLSVYKLFKSDPGYLEQNKMTLSDALKIKKSLTQKDYCYTCKVLKPLRSKHDLFTQKCVARYNSYFGWCYQPIGFKNQIHYLILLFLTFMTILLYNFIIFTFIHQKYNFEKNGTFHFFNFESYFNLIKSAYQFHSWILAISLGSLFIGFWIFYLFFQSLFFAALNVTQDEFYSINKDSYLIKNGSFSNPFSLGWKKNLLQFFGWKFNVDWNNIFDLPNSQNIKN